MPLNSHQLAALVERARLKAPPVRPPAPAPQRPVRPRQAAPASPPPQPEKPAPLPAEPTAPDDRPWFLDKSSWRFHRRFYADAARRILPPAQADPVRPRRASQREYWRVTLQGSSRAFTVAATKWRLITILPKDWQPPAQAE
jgi:hypothetical protein